jgi:hypothetical protein
MNYEKHYCSWRGRGGAIHSLLRQTYLEIPTASIKHSASHCSFKANIIHKVDIGIAMSYWLDGQDSIPSRARDFSLLHSVRTGSEAHPTSHEMGSGTSSPEGKAVEA